MYRTSLLLASLLTASQAWVQFPGATGTNADPWALPTPKNILPIQQYQPTESVEERSISTIPTITTIPVPTHSEKPFGEWIVELIKRQGGAAAVANPGAAQPTGGQVSPVTTYSILSNGNMLRIPYTQTFPNVNQQWPTPSKGTIGMGTIQGQVGQVKTKRSEQIPQTIATPTSVPEQTLNRSEEELVQVLEIRVEEAVSEDSVFDDGAASSSSSAVGLLVSTNAVLAASTLAFLALL